MEPRNGSQASRLGFRVLNVTPTEADIDLFDVIGDPWEGTTAADFVKELRGLKNVQRINLHINSPGGLVTDGLAMYNAIQQSPAYVTAFIESQAASIATIVAMAANKIAIAKNAQMFIHDAHTIGLGNAADFRSMADQLDEESQNLASIYADRTGKTAREWRKAMQANNGEGTGYRGQAAVDAGLADELMTVPASADVKRMAAMRLPGRVAALVLNQAEPSTSTITAALGACLYDALTDMAQDWLEDGVITMDEFLPLSGLVTDLVSAMDIGLDKLGLSDRVIPAPDDDEGTPMAMPDMTDFAPELFKQITARGYEPPMPVDITRLIERNMAKGVQANG